MTTSEEKNQLCLIITDKNILGLKI